MLSSIEDDNPVVFFEHKAIYGIPSEVPENVEPIPLGKARVAKEGTDVTIVTYGKQVLDAMEAAETLSAEGINAEVIDLRSLYPWDEEAVLSSVEKTSKVVLVSEETKRGAYIAEIASVIADKAFYHLDAPIKRVGALDTPVPFAPALEQAMLPNAVDIVNAVRELF